MAPRKPAVPVDVDFDALAKEASATSEPIVYVFKLHGHTFTMPTGDDCDFRVLDALGRNELTEAIRYLLGDAQYAKFTSKSVSMGTLTAVLEGWSGKKGTKLGE